MRQGEVSVGLVAVLSMRRVARDATVGLEHEEIRQIQQQYAGMEILLDSQRALAGEMLDRQARLDLLERFFDASAAIIQVREEMMRIALGIEQ